MRRLVALMLFGMVLAISSALLADVVHLKNGKKWEGEILKDTDEQVVVKIYLGKGSTKMTFKKSEVESIEKKPLQKPEGEEKESAKKDEKGEEKTEEAKEEAPASIPPAPAKEEITGYRENSWGIPSGKLRAPGGTRDVLENPNYFALLDPPADIAGMIPEDYPAPKNLFSNVYYYQHGDYPEYKQVFCFYKDRLYGVRGKIAMDIAGVVMNYAEWVAERRKELGGETEMKDNGTLVWDSAEGWAQMIPAFQKEGKPAPRDNVLSYEIQLYNKKLRQEILDWIKANVKK